MAMLAGQGDTIHIRDLARTVVDTDNGLICADLVNENV